MKESERGKFWLLNLHQSFQVCLSNKENWSSPSNKMKELLLWYLISHTMSEKLLKMWKFLNWIKVDVFAYKQMKYEPTLQAIFLDHPGWRIRAVIDSNELWQLSKSKSKSKVQSPKSKESLYSAVLNSTRIVTKSSPTLVYGLFWQLTICYILVSPSFLIKTCLLRVT